MKKLLTISIVLTLAAWLMWERKPATVSDPNLLFSQQEMKKTYVEIVEIKEMSGEVREGYKRGLMKLLNEMKEVDFGAELKDGVRNKNVFVNPEYEKKPYIWKMCYCAAPKLRTPYSNFFYSGARN
ncbi:hypothetical protein [Chitinophaga sp. Ak27]|uniref:hypothetical protein n=1 Tax=Chitinophaga sp. Ak27 TaxID=2726116 RepID=UPI00145F6BFB|nr:hypothetical protein [Chitinophaga sp. Ak27]NLU91202.1 hypothetical protein [Chitinophaga sp. Ak27]